MTAFDPKPHLTKLNQRQKQADGSYKTITVEYLPVAARVLWFRTVCPEGSIDAQQVQLDSVHCVARCEVRDGAGRLLGADFGMCTAEMWKRYPEKASTTATGRALALAGFGTEFVGDELDEGVAEAGVAAAADTPKRAKLGHQRMPERVAVAAAVAEPAPGDDEAARRQFWQTAKDLEYPTKRAVHALFAVEPRDGALAEWKAEQGLSWAELTERLTDLHIRRLADAGDPEPADEDENPLWEEIQRPHGDPVDQRKGRR